MFQSVLISLALCKSQFQASVIFPPRFAGADLAVLFAPFALEACTPRINITIAPTKLNSIGGKKRSNYGFKCWTLDSGGASHKSLSAESMNHFNRNVCTFRAVRATFRSNALSASSQESERIRSMWTARHEIPEVKTSNTRNLIPSLNSE